MNLHEHTSVDGFERQLDQPALRCELECVRQQVAEHLVDSIEIPEYLVGQPVVTLDAEMNLPLDGEYLEGIFELGEDGVELNRPRLEATPARLEAAHVEELRHESRER